MVYLSICHTKRIPTDPKNRPTATDQQKMADFVTDFFFYLLVRIGEIWVLRSPTIKKYKSLFFLSLKDIKLMYYMVNDDINKVYQKNWPTMTANDI